MTENPHPLQEESALFPKSNRLLSEKSPYLLQHAHNPVHWYPWSEEAFQAAAREDKPIFLSVGYSTCHWCHVMAHESFEDPVVADLMNQAFICIKVDREERPDIDQIYMSVAQAMTGRGGWPLTIIMTPEKKPFFAATYIPKTGRHGQAGLMEIIPRIQELWDKNRKELSGSADKILDYLQTQRQPSARGEDANLDAAYLARGYEALASIYDPQNGGFGTAPKFPSPHNLFFLLRYWHRTGDEQALQMVEETLQAMRMGGIYDHVGFGFHRYSTDGQWQVPHFEKMLYDQALMAIAYTECFQATRKEEYATVACEILDYVLRDMTDPQGGFFSAEDADSEGEEGKFYLWTAEGLKETLDNEEFKLLIRLFDVHESGNFEREGNILRLRSSIKDGAFVLKISEPDLYERLELIRSKLFLAREKRVHPFKDDKILTDWNGLMIAALAKAAQALPGPKGAEYERATIKAADFILKETRTADGRLLHRYRGEAGIAANLDDYAFLIWGLLDLYETVFDTKYLKAALQLNQIMMQHFWDKDQGGLFFSADDAEDLLLRRKEYYDGAIPSGNSIAMHNLLRLMHLTGQTELEEKAWDLARDNARTSGQSLGQSMLLCSLDYALGPTSEIALLGSKQDAVIIKMLEAMRTRFLPNKSTILVCGKEIREIAPFTRNLPPEEETIAAYVCTDHVCSLPTASPNEMMKQFA
ncbi:MAG: thioredoxin domain-containing protein [Methanothrix sp.]|nr:thioredoxin domain-containing protein [Methanothrix sp.]MDD4446149.1 thioredoxin domain-containing protein [Methanothrix sp.]